MMWGVYVKKKRRRLSNSLCFHTCRFTGKTLHNVINMGSYNYLGFAENNTDFMKTVAEKTSQFGVGVCSTRQEIGEFGQCLC